MLGYLCMANVFHVLAIISITCTHISFIVARLGVGGMARCWDVASREMILLRLHAFLGVYSSTIPNYHHGRVVRMVILIMKVVS